jgi:MFS superfamily sulfate permease-like transporter
MGEWNDAVENDIMELKREVLEKFMYEGIHKFILIAENVLNFHSSDSEYYQELYEETNEENGWVVALNMPEQSQYDFRKAHLDRYIELIELENWRTYKPFHLFKKIDAEQKARLT